MQYNYIHSYKYGENKIVNKNFCGKTELLGESVDSLFEEFVSYLPNSGGVVSRWFSHLFCVFFCVDKGAKKIFLRFIFKIEFQKHRR